MHSELKNHDWTKKNAKEYAKSILRLEYIENMILYPVFGRDKLLLLLNCKIMLLQHRLMATPSVDIQSQLETPVENTKLYHTLIVVKGICPYPIFRAEILKIVKSIQPQSQIRRS